jgi:hypothetical protein
MNEPIPQKQRPRADGSSKTQQLGDWEISMALVKGKINAGELLDYDDGSPTARTSSSATTVPTRSSPVADRT